MTRPFQDVLVFKKSYETAINRLRNWTTTISIGESTPKGRANQKLIERILDNLEQKQVSPEDFLGVICTYLKWPRRTKTGRMMRYPYLSFLSSATALWLYDEAKAEIAKKTGGLSGATDAFIASRRALNYEAQFSGAFSTGFTIMDSLLASGRVKADDPWSIMGAFLSWMEIFSPEFVITHSKFRVVAEAREEDLTSFQSQFRSVLLEWLGPTLEQWQRHPWFRKALVVSRKAVARREQRLVPKPNDEWKRTWRTLI